MATTDDEPPPWACGRADDYMDVGAVLPTRDGRVMGNATVTRRMRHAAMGGAFVVVLTDAGSRALMTRRELEAQFWPPVWRRDVRWAPPAMGKPYRPGRWRGPVHQVRLWLAGCAVALALRLAPRSHPDSVVLGHALGRLSRWSVPK